MPVTYRPAKSVQRIAQKLIPIHHDHLDDVRIDYVFRSETAKSGGKAIWGRAKKISGLNAYLAADDAGDELTLGDAIDDFYVIEISEPVWAILDDKAKVALVDHELCHCAIKVDQKGDIQLTMAPHDLEEFESIVKRHGLWRPEIEVMAATMREYDQADLFDGIDATVSINGGPALPLGDPDTIQTIAEEFLGGDAA